MSVGSPRGPGWGLWGPQGVVGGSEVPVGPQVAEGGGPWVLLGVSPRTCGMAGDVVTMLTVSPQSPSTLSTGSSTTRTSPSGSATTATSTTTPSSTPTRPPSAWGWGCPPSNRGSVGPRGGGAGGVWTPHCCGAGAQWGCRGAGAAVLHPGGGLWGVLGPFPTSPHPPCVGGGMEGAWPHLAPPPVALFG